MHTLYDISSVHFFFLMLEKENAVITLQYAIINNRRRDIYFPNYFNLSYNIVQFRIARTTHLFYTDTKYSYDYYKTNNV